MVLDFKDEQLCDHLNHVLSGLLPHESYQPSTFSLLYPALSTILPSTEARGLYFAFYTVLEKFFKLQSSMEAGAYQVNIARDRFATALTNNLPDLILEPHMQVSEIMSDVSKSGMSSPTFCGVSRLQSKYSLAILCNTSVSGFPSCSIW